jgi:hypothetical protein
MFTYGSTDGGEIFCLTPRAPYTTHEYFWHSFLLEAELTNVAGIYDSWEDNDN